jgi:putative glutamine amidotransferase
MRPIIAVPSYPRVPERRIKGWNADNVGVPAPYLEALRRAGGIEWVVMTESLDQDAVGEILDRAHALLLLGGGDLDPSTYGAEPTTEKIYGVSAHRDTSELDLTRAAVARGVPVLGICRGHQVVNVALGGVLDQHIPERDGVSEHGRPGVGGGGLEHEVEVERGTRLADALGADRVVASCHHHQAVETPGAGLRVVARATDGIVEGTELADPDGPWVVTVQWHPEDTAATDPAQQGLFDTLVRRAAP